MVLLELIKELLILGAILALLGVAWVLLSSVAVGVKYLAVGFYRTTLDVLFTLFGKETSWAREKREDAEFEQRLKQQEYERSLDSFKRAFARGEATITPAPKIVNVPPPLPK